MVELPSASAHRTSRSRVVSDVRPCDPLPATSRSTRRGRSAAGSTNSPANARRNTSINERSRSDGRTPHAPAASAMAMTSGPSCTARSEHTDPVRRRRGSRRPPLFPCRRRDRGPPGPCRRDLLRAPRGLRGHRGPDPGRRPARDGEGRGSAPASVQGFHLRRGRGSGRPSPRCIGMPSPRPEAAREVARRPRRDTGPMADAHPESSRATRRARTCSSMRPTPSIGSPGARKPSRERWTRPGRSSCRSAMPRATGVT